ncbi:hypothetical protein B0H34DRAFT_811601 [Crassisporium funariophilum]|nr:hypothetical protein B0H34DRAFT_811601 [Crassisporium funariophilum]
MDDIRVSNAQFEAKWTRRGGYAPIHYSSTAGDRSRSPSDPGHASALIPQCSLNGEREDAAPHSGSGNVTVGTSCLHLAPPSFYLRNPYVSLRVPVLHAPTRGYILESSVFANRNRDISLAGSRTVYRDPSRFQSYRATLVHIEHAKRVRRPVVWCMKRRTSGWKVSSSSTRPITVQRTIEWGLPPLNEYTDLYLTPHTPAIERTFEYIRDLPCPAMTTTAPGLISNSREWQPEGVKGLDVLLYKIAPGSKHSIVAAQALLLPLPMLTEDDGHCILKWLDLQHTVSVQKLDNQAFIRNRSNISVCQRPKGELSDTRRGNAVRVGGTLWRVSRMPRQYPILDVEYLEQTGSQETQLEEGDWWFPWAAESAEGNAAFK